MTNDWILGWWNLVFLAPFALALIYLFVYSVTGVTFGDADHDTDFGHDVDGDVDADADADVDHDMEVDHDVDADMDGDVDVDADADADVDADVDAEVDHDIDADADADHDADGEAGHGAGGSSTSSIFAAMTWLGIGRVPVSIVLLVLMLSWGVIGFCSNQVLRQRIAEPARIGFISIAVALVGSALVTRVTTRLVATVLPDGESYAVRRHELLGSVGKAVSAINASFGLVAVHDEHGHLFQVPARTRGEGIDIAKGASVRLVAYTAKNRTFHVIQNDPAAAAAEKNNNATRPVAGNAK